MCAHRFVYVCVMHTRPTSSLSFILSAASMSSMASIMSLDARAGEAVTALEAAAAAAAALGVAGLPVVVFTRRGAWIITGLTLITPAMMLLLNDDDDDDDDGGDDVDSGEDNYRCSRRVRRRGESVFLNSFTNTQSHTALCKGAVFLFAVGIWRHKHEIPSPHPLPLDCWHGSLHPSCLKPPVFDNKTFGRVRLAQRIAWRSGAKWGEKRKRKRREPAPIQNGKKHSNRSGCLYCLSFYLVFLKKVSSRRTVRSGTEVSFCSFFFFPLMSSHCVCV